MTDLTRAAVKKMLELHLAGRHNDFNQPEWSTSARCRSDRNSAFSATFLSSCGPLFFFWNAFQVATGDGGMQRNRGRTETGGHVHDTHSRFCCSVVVEQSNNKKKKKENRLQKKKNESVISTKLSTFPENTWKLGRKLKAGHDETPEFFLKNFDAI